jgi:hypothetical protein
MKKLMFIALSLILLLSACSPKPMTEKGKIDTIQGVFSDYKREKAVAVLKENEAIIGTSELISISGINQSDILRNVKYIVSFRTMDKTYYYGLYSIYHDNSAGALLMRVRKGDMLTGEVIWNREDQDELMTLLYYNTTRCYVFMEHRSGSLEYDMSFRLEKEIDGEWEEIAFIQANTPKKLKRDETAREKFIWEDDCGSLYPGTYKIIVPVTHRGFDAEHKSYEKQLELTAEFIIEPQ